MSMSNTEKQIKDIRRNTRRKFSSEEKIRSELKKLTRHQTVLGIGFTCQGHDALKRIPLRRTLTQVRWIR